ncbi:MAG: methylamine utilization protein [Phycisphaerales bacterium]|nr:methylamine utilization protein [Phycisphaerales bacterium]
MGAITLGQLALAAGASAPGAHSQSASDRVAGVAPALRARIMAMSPLPSAPPDLTNKFADDSAAAELGQMFFFEQRFSSNGAVSCASCHDPDRGFADGRPLAQGLQVGTRHTPSVIDSAFQRWLTWDGRADSLWAQALHPFENQAEMGSTRAQMIEVIRADPVLTGRYTAIFGQLPPSGDTQAIDTAFANIGKSLAAYERRLISLPSAFDRFVVALGDESGAPDSSHYPEAALRGLLLFVGKAGCHQCHYGPALSDGEFHRLGLADGTGQSLKDRGRLDGVAKVKADPFNAAGKFSDAPQGPRAALVRSLLEDPDLFGRMRTPSLRAAVRTPPYMHDGRFATLEDVVRFYSTLDGAVLDHHGETVLTPLSLSESEISDIAEFLRSVDGGPISPHLCGRVMPIIPP